MALQTDQSRKRLCRIKNKFQIRLFQSDQDLLEIKSELADVIRSPVKRGKVIDRMLVYRNQGIYNTSYR